VSDRFQTEIRIGGKLPLSKVQELIDIINSGDWGLDWESVPLRLKSKDDLMDCIAHGESLVLTDTERRPDLNDDIQEVLQELGLTYKIVIEPKYEYLGELKFWSPLTGLVELECESGGRPIATQEDLKEILKLLMVNPPFSDLARKKLRQLTQEFTVPAFTIEEK